MYQARRHHGAIYVHVHGSFVGGCPHNTEIEKGRRGRGKRAKGKGIKSNLRDNLRDNLREQKRKGGKK
jgi:hypothetical protein